jgi:hypothetical protein
LYHIQSWTGRAGSAFSTPEGVEKEGEQV